MLLKDLLTELSKPGENTRSVAKRMEGIGEKRLVSLLKQAGYEFSNIAPKGWHYIKEGKEPLEEDIYDHVKSSSSNVKLSSHKGELDVNSNSHKGELDVNSNSLKIRVGEVKVKSISHDAVETRKEQGFEGEHSVKNDYSKLMYEELKAIRGLLQTGEPKGNDTAKDSLLERIDRLNSAASKTRKTIVIDDEVARQLDQFAKKKRVNKSDLIEVALLDLFERYS